MKARPAAKPPSKQSKSQKHSHGDSQMQKQYEAMWGKLSPEKQASLQSNISKIKVLKVASDCSGADIHAAIGDLVMAKGGKEKCQKRVGKYECTFACECEPFKAKFISQTTGADVKSGLCVFKDVCLMMQERQPCFTHAKPDGCLIDKSYDLLVASWVCKDWSKLKLNGQKPTLDDNTTVRTFLAIIDMLDQHRPQAWIGENMEDLVKEETGLKQFIDEQLYSIGYVASLVPIKHSDYGGCTHRTRGWVAAVDFRDSGIGYEAARKLVREISTIAKGMKIGSTTYKNWVLPSTNKDVTSELARLQAAKKTDGDELDKNTKWQELLNKELHNKGWTRSQIVAPPEHQVSPWFSLLPDRERMNLGFQLALHPDSTSLELSQMPGRSTHPGKDCILQTLYPNSRLWLADEKRWMLGKDALLCHGLPSDVVKKLAGFSDNQLIDLAGNSKTAQSFMAIFISLLACWPSIRAPTNHKRKASSESEVCDTITSIFGEGDLA